MSVWGIALVKDEVDIIVQTVGHMLEECDGVLVADNGSTDGTREILDALKGNLVVQDDPDPAYYQSAKMSALAAQAAERGAKWVVPFDADEWWYSPFGRLGDELMLRNETVSPATVYDHVATPSCDTVETMGWRRREALPLPKVACRPSAPVTIAQGNHGASYGEEIDLGLVVRHYPYRSVEQFERKVRNGAAAYAATDLPEREGAHWRDYGRLLETEGTLEPVFREYFYSDDPETDPTLISDPCLALKS